MLRLPRLCTFLLPATKQWSIDVRCRFIECEKWRKEFGTDELVRTFDYTEKPQVFAYYPQYYHKTDKVHPPLIYFA